MKHKIIISGIIGIFLLDLVIALTGFGGVKNDLFRNISLQVGQFISIGTVLYALRLVGLKSILGKSLLFILLYLIVGTTGSTLFTYFDFTAGDVQFPSIADVFILAGYPLFAAGLFFQVKAGKFQLTKKNLFLLIFLSLVLALLVTYFGIYLPYDATAPFLVNFTQALYGLADLILILIFVFVLLLALDYKGGKFFTPWFAIFLGVMVTLLGDILFGMYVIEYMEKSGINILIDITWRLSHVFYAFGFYQLAMIVLATQNEIRDKIAAEKKLG